MICYSVARMAGGRKKEEGQLLIRLPENIMAALKADALRCRRSNTKQIEAILVDLYSLEDIGLKDTSSTRSHVCSDGTIKRMAGMIRVEKAKKAAG